MRLVVPGTVPGFGGLCCDSADHGVAMVPTLVGSISSKPQVLVNCIFVMMCFRVMFGVKGCSS